MNLVIVESPAKSKTIEKFLGTGFKVLASYGHVRDLPQKVLGVDVAKNYAPDYQILPKAKKAVAELKSFAKTAKDIYLATDLDREGEAISWHLTYALGLKPDDPKLKRIVFHEITKTAIDKAMAHPRGLDMHLVDAQQARRILDRLVGYKLSPLLWKKVRGGLSAGRVQSVAVRLIVEREREISAFKPVEFWLIGAVLSRQKEEQTFKSFLVGIDGKSMTKYDIKSQKQADDIVKKLEGAKYKVVEVLTKEAARTPSAPFTTSTLQMEAARKFGYSPKQTMMLAQKLYEDGHITYMRTDSTNLSDDAKAAVAKTIIKEYGQKYISATARVYTTKTKHAQEAHEAIHPTHFEERQATNDRQGQNLYELIWKRAVASQMQDAKILQMTVKIEAKTDKSYIFQTTGEKIMFNGFMKVYLESKDEESSADEYAATLPPLEKNEILKFWELIKDQKFTEPPKRYTEAMLVKKLEGLGIGRPSTYAPTLDTIQQRGYVILKEKKFVPEEIGMIVTDLLVNNFKDIVDYQFTAEMEDEFDEIAEGKLEWQTVIDAFYKPFAQNLTLKNKELVKDDVIGAEKIDEKCPECGKELKMRFGRFGKFVACSGYPECKYTRPLESDKPKDMIVLESGEGASSLKKAESEKCEKCGSDMVMKEGRFGKFLACENYPKCKNTKTVASKTGVKCPECEKGELIEKTTRKRGKSFWGCSTYPKCKYATWENPTEPKPEVSEIPNS